MHLGYFHVLILWHNSKVGIGDVHVREVSPISNYFMYFDFYPLKGICVASHVFVAALYLGHFRPLSYGTNLRAG